MFFRGKKLGNRVIGYGYAVITAVFGFCRSSAGVESDLSALLVSTSHPLDCRLRRLLVSGW